MSDPDMELMYEQKYLKYKKKYLELKRLEKGQLGGLGDSFVCIFTTKELGEAILPQLKDGGLSMDELNKHFNGNAYQIIEGSKDFILMTTPETTTPETTTPETTTPETTTPKTTTPKTTTPETKSSKTKSSKTKSSLKNKATLNDFNYKSSDNETFVETLYLPYVQKLNDGTGPKFNYILIVKKPFVNLKKLLPWNKTPEKYTLHLSKLK